METNIKVNDQLNMNWNSKDNCKRIVEFESKGDFDIKQVRDEARQFADWLECNTSAGFLRELYIKIGDINGIAYDLRQRG